MAHHSCSTCVFCKDTGYLSAKCCHSKNTEDKSLGDLNPESKCAWRVKETFLNKLFYSVFG